MVNNNEATSEFKLTTEDINVAFQAHPEAAQTAQMNLLKRLIIEKSSLEVNPTACVAMSASIRLFSH